MLDTVKNLMFDVASGSEIFDEEQSRVISKAEANEAIRKVCFEELGITKDSKDKQLKRALKSDKATALFEVIEEIIDTNINYGLSENEFFNQFVETKNIADGDKNQFYVEDDVILTVSQISGDHHDLQLQRLGEGSEYSISTGVYGIKVGSDFRQFLLGRKDWSAFVDAVTKAYVNKIQTVIATQFANGTNLISVPSILTGTGTLSASTKSAFDAIIEKVESANECPVVIMGTKTALKNLNALATVNWTDPASSVKEAVATTGIIGNYEGTDLMVIPQKFTDKTLATPIVDNSKLYIMPLVDNKFIKFVDQGETVIELTNEGDTIDDKQSYEVQRRFGVGTLMTRYHGVWTV